MNTRLTFEDGKSSKFYALSLAGTDVTVQWGRIGSAGQSQVKSHTTDTAAQKTYNDLRAEKLKKGYVEDAAAASTAAATTTTAAPAAAPAKAVAAAATTAAAPAKGKGSKASPAAAAAPAKASKAPKLDLPDPALADPDVKGLDLTVWRKADVPQPESDPTPFPPGGFVIEGYTLSFGDGEEVVVTDPKGKKLKSVPPKLRQNEDYQALMRGRKDDRARTKRAKRVLEDRMITGASLGAEELAWLVQDDAFAPMLKGLLVVPVGPARDAGLLVNWDDKKGLGLLPQDHDARWHGWSDVEVVHPMKAGDMTAWQDLLVDLSLQQLLVQAFREVRTVPASQRLLTESGQLSGRECRSASSVERSLMEEGWRCRRGRARRKLSLRTDDGVIAVEAWFDYGEFYMPSDPTTSGSFGFLTATGKEMPFKDVPPVLLSEAIRSLELCLAQAGAAKDEEEEGEEESEEEKAEGEEGEDADAEKSDDDDD